MDAVQWKGKVLQKRMALTGAGWGLGPAANAQAFPADCGDPMVNIKQYSVEKMEVQPQLMRQQSEDTSSNVVDMGQPAPPRVALLVNDLPVAGVLGCQHVKLRKPVTFVEEDILPPAQERQPGFVVNGDGKDICQLMEEEPVETYKGVIYNDKVLCSSNGHYDEGKQYKAFTGKVCEGGFGKAVMCEDLTSGKTFICKKTDKTVPKNEVLVLLMCGGEPGIPELYGVIRRGQTTEIFMEFAGLSLKDLCKDYGQRLSDPGTVLGFAFQGFKTVQTLHSKDIQHLDIKPENICVDMGQKVPGLKIIDPGSSQMPGEVTTEGLTYEYLSPESADTYIRMGLGQMCEGLRHGEGTDVWAMALSLIYCLCGHHPMIYACTGRFTYQSQNMPQDTQRLRCLVQIRNMTDAHMQQMMENIQQLTGRRWPAVLMELFTNTLRCNPQDRWSAQQATTFIMDYLKREALQALVLSRAVQLRVPVAQNVQESRLMPWGVAATPQAPHYNDSHSLHTQRGKRKCGGESSMHGGKVLRK